MNTVANIYAPPMVFGTWYELINVWGFHGNVSFDEVVSGDTQILYEVMVYDGQGRQTIQSAMPGVPFYTVQLASIRAKGVPTGTSVQLDVEYNMG